MITAQLFIAAKTWLRLWNSIMYAHTLPVTRLKKVNRFQSQVIITRVPVTRLSSTEITNDVSLVLTFQKSFRSNPWKWKTLELKRIVREIYNPIENLSALGRDASLDSDLAVHLKLSWLDLNMRKDWEKYWGDDADPPPLEKLQSFLQSQILTLEATEGGCKSF